MRILSPVSLPAPPPAPAAPRLRRLAGARIGLLDNGKSHADRLLGGLGEALAREHGVRLVPAVKPNAWGAASDAVLARLGECDAVVTALGD